MKLNPFLFFSKSSIIPFFLVFFFCITTQAQKITSENYFQTTVDKNQKKGEIINSIEKAQQTINTIQSKSRLSWEILNHKQQLQSDKMVIATIQDVFSSNSHVNYRNLTLYHNILSDIDSKNSDSKKELVITQDKLENLKKELEKIPKDSSIKYLIDFEKTTKNPKVHDILVQLNSKWTKTYEVVNKNLDSVNNWVALVAINGINTQDLLKTSDSLSRDNWKKMLISNAKTPLNSNSKLDSKSIRKGFAVQAQGEKKILNYYSNKYSANILWKPLFFIFLIGGWILYNIQKMKRNGLDLSKSEQFNFLPQSWFWLPIVIVLSFVHLIDIHAPWTYLLFIQIVLALIISKFIWKDKSGHKITYFILGLIGLLVLSVILGNSHLNYGFQYIVLIFSLAQLLLLVCIFKNRKQLIQLPRLSTFAISIGIILSSIAIILCLFNKIQLALMLNNAAMVAVLQIISLSILKQMIVELLLLQLVSSRLKVGILRKIDSAIINKTLKLPAFFIVLWLWLTMLISNLNIYDGLETAITHLITTTIKIGSFSFSIAGILLFFIIIWVAHLIQQYIGFFFGDVGIDEDEEFKKQRSRMLATKLVVICIGYLLAIAASGLPMDKITIVLGALSVGVGMGLQNIVNNFVSGIILIFDRPLQLGDTIEVKGYSGKVKEMGIRSSTLLTEDGGEVIIPNGDLLSNSIVNWTLSNNQKRENLEFKLRTDKTKETIEEIVLNVLKNSDLISKSKDPNLFFVSVNDSEINIKVFFWCTNVNKTEWTKSEMRFVLHKTFRENEILVL
jgi:potassium efflux system protein